MADVVGGLRSRFLFDSVYDQIDAGIDALGWYDFTRIEPVSFIPEPPDDSDEVQLNTIALSEGDTFDREGELGSHLTRSEYVFYLDIYAESGPIGRMIAHDLRDLIMGRHGGRQHPVFTIYDLSVATPFSIGYAEVDRVNVSREPAPTKPWQKFWYIVRFDLSDSYDPLNT